MVSNEQSGAFSCTFAGEQAQSKSWGGGISIVTVKSPAVMFGPR